MKTTRTKTHFLPAPLDYVASWAKSAQIWSASEPSSHNTSDYFSIRKRDGANAFEHDSPNCSLFWIPEIGFTGFSKRGRSLTLVVKYQIQANGPLAPRQKTASKLSESNAAQLKVFWKGPDFLKMTKSELHSFLSEHVLPINLSQATSAKTIWRGLTRKRGSSVEDAFDYTYLPITGALSVDHHTMPV
jgi:hypothetical protein